MTLGLSKNVNGLIYAMVFSWMLNWIKMDLIDYEVDMDFDTWIMTN